MVIKNKGNPLLKGINMSFFKDNINCQVRLAHRPENLPQSSDWILTSEQVLEPNDNEVLVRVIYISIEPAMRGWIKDRKSYLPPVAVNEIMRAAGIGEVIQSKNANFEVGDYVAGRFGVQQYSILNGSALDKINSTFEKLPVYLSTLGTKNMLGHPGMTAYFGLLEIGKPKKGDTMVVSAAAGGVGMLAGQIAKIEGCRVIGITSSKSKCDYLINELGFDAAINYKSDDLNEALQTFCPNGIDIYFDNVGGDILNIVLAHIAMNARIVVCGAISQYNQPILKDGPNNYLMLLSKRAMMKGFLVTDFIEKYHLANEQMSAWIDEGKLKTKEDIAEGIENFSQVLLKLFKSENFGKLILKV